MNILPKTRGGALWRFALAAILVVGLTATTTAVAGLLEVKNIVDVLKLSPVLKGVNVTPPAPEAPETLLLVGSDHRAGEPFQEAQTDTMMLVRIDDSSSTINVMSIPRDLAVLLPGSGGSYEGKLNAAYEIDGDKLLLQILQQQVFPGLQVTHVIDTNFAGFSDLVDAIGCVFTDVDHRYYNVSQPGYDNYSTIDIEPGYQKLCGDHQSPSGALAFVRFRHTDSDVVRNARQQDFLRWAKQDYSAGQLLANKDKLLTIFGRHTETDHSLRTTDGLLDLFGVVYNADGRTIKSIRFPEYFGTCESGGETPCYVYANGSGPEYSGTIGRATPEEANAYHRFLKPTIAPPTPTVTTNTTGTSTTSTASTPTTARRPVAPANYDRGLVNDAHDGLSQAALLGNAGLPVMYPKLIVSGPDVGYCFSSTGNCDDPAEPASAYDGSYPRSYLIHAQNGKAYAAYVMTLEINSALGQYFTVQGTTWQHPPIFNSPLKVQIVDHKKLFEYFDGGNIAVAAYHTSRGVYWISNTLGNNISNTNMIGMAASLTPAG